MLPRLKAKFKSTVKEFGISVEYSTPHVHTPIGMVERNIWTLETFIKPFLLENNTLKQAGQRAIKLMRFSESAPLKMSPSTLTLRNQLDVNRETE